MLNNNHPQMKTVVETFIIEETAELIYDNEKLEAWNKHVQELGLEGQTRIVKKEKSPIPFMFLNPPQRAIFETLCPRKMAVEKYDVTPIPVEILDLVALSKKEGYFDRIEVWYDDQTPDPVCIGINRMFGELNNYNWKTQKEAELALGRSLNPWNNEEKHYLLGKWADVKASFEELKQRAIKRFKAEKITTANTQINYYKRQIEDVDIEATNKFGAADQVINDLPF